jgi:hypothetical protein
MHNGETIPNLIDRIIRNHQANKSSDCLTFSTGLSKINSF